MPQESLHPQMRLLLPDASTRTLPRSGALDLPNDLQSKLDLAGRRGGLVQGRLTVRDAGAKAGAVRVKHRIVLPEGIQKTWRQKIRVIEDVEELRPELQVECLRYCWNM